MSLLSVLEARKQLLSQLSIISTEIIKLGNAHQRVLAEDIYSPINSPLFTNSSMDGFAIRSTDAEKAVFDAPVKLKVVDDIPAGYTSDYVIKKGEAARIMTGAPLPVGADAIVPIENTNLFSQVNVSQLPEDILIFRSVEAGGYVRSQGEDFSKGDLILKRGSRLAAQHIGILAHFGIASVPVYRKPKVALFSTGDELLELTDKLQAGKIRDTNSITLSALCNDTGCNTILLGIVKDRPEAIRQTLKEAVEYGVDLILSSAGVSVGAYDFVKEVIQENGQINFWRVNMRPGKPFMFGNFGGIPYIGLPGNPVSSFVSFEVFLRPALNYIGGSRNFTRRELKVRLMEDIISDGRESYLRASLYDEGGEMLAKLAGHQGSGNMFSLVQANGMIVVPSGVKSLKSGSEVMGWFL